MVVTVMVGPSCRVVGIRPVAGIANHHAKQVGLRWEILVTGPIADGAQLHRW